MTEITFHRSRMPGEADIFEVKTNSLGVYTGCFYFEVMDDDSCKLVETEMLEEEEDEMKYLIEACKALIVQKDQRIVYDEEHQVIAELALGPEYK